MFQHHLVEEIVIPIGTVAGISSVSFLTYYLIKRRKKFQREKQENISLQSINNENFETRNEGQTLLQKPNETTFQKLEEIEIIQKPHEYETYIEAKPNLRK